MASTSSAAADGGLPALVDCAGLMRELGVKRGVAEGIMRQLPTVRLPGVRKVYVKRADVVKLIEASTVGVDRIVAYEAERELRSRFRADRAEYRLPRLLTARDIANEFAIPEAAAWALLPRIPCVVFPLVRRIYVEQEEALAYAAAFPIDRETMRWPLVERRVAAWSATS